MRAGLGLSPAGPGSCPGTPGWARPRWDGQGASVRESSFLRG